MLYRNDLFINALIIFMLGYFVILCIGNFFQWLLPRRIARLPDRLPKKVWNALCGVLALLWLGVSYAVSLWILSIKR